MKKLKNIRRPRRRSARNAAAKAQRMISAAGIQFKGSGWYVTDYKGKNSGATSVEGSSDGGSSKSGDQGRGFEEQQTRSRATRNRATKGGESKASGVGENLGKSCEEKEVMRGVVSFRVSDSSNTSEIRCRNAGFAALVPRWPSGIPSCFRRREFCRGARAPTGLLCAASARSPSVS